MVTPIRIAVAGAPLAGKSRLLYSLGTLPGAVGSRRVEHVPSGFFQGMPVSVMELRLPYGGEDLILTAVPGAAPVEAAPAMLLGHTCGLLLLDGRPERLELEQERWAAVRDLFAADRWCAIVNRRKESVTPVEDLLAHVGAPALRTMELSVDRTEDASRVAEFLLTHARRASDRPGT